MSSFQSHVTRPISEKLFCPDHPKHVVDQYCQECHVGLCLTCIVRGHDPTHKTHDISTKAYHCRTFIRSAFNRHELFVNQVKYDYDRWILRAEPKLRQSLKEQQEALEKIKYDVIFEVTKTVDNLLNRIRMRVESIGRHEDRSMDYFRAQNKLAQYGQYLLKSASDMEVIERHEETIRLMKEETKPIAPEMRSLKLGNGHDMIAGEVEAVINKIELINEVIPLPIIVPVQHDTRHTPELSTLHRPRAEPTIATVPTLNKIKSIQFQEPIKGLLIDKMTKRVLVRTADATNPIREFTMTGQMVRGWGRGKSGLDDIGGLGYDSKRNLILIPTGSKLRLFNRQGVQVGKVSYHRYHKHRFKKLSDVTYSKSKDAYVINDLEQKCVWYVQAESKRITGRVAPPGDETHQLGQPFFLTCGQTQAEENLEKVFVSDSENNCIKVYDCEGNYRDTMGCHSGDRLHQPLGVALTESGRLLVCDHNRVVVMGEDDGVVISEVLLDSHQLDCGDPISVAVASDTGHVIVSVYNDKDDTQSVHFFNGFVYN